MKKILTIAIALVMVFALASTALAAGWDIVVEEKEVEDIKISIDALSPDTKEADKEFAPGAEFQVILEKTYPVVEEDEVIAVVTVEFPKAAKISEDMMEYLEKGMLKLNISNSNVEFTAADSVTSVDPAIVDDEITVYFDDASCGLTYYYVVSGLVEATKKDAKITATLGVYNEWDENNYFRWEDAAGEDWLVVHGEKAFQVFADKGSVVFYVEGAAEDADSSAKIDVTKPIQVVVDNTTYDVTKQVNNELAFVNGQVYTTGETYDKVKAVFDEVFKALGFTYEGVKYMSEEHFVEYFGTIMETEVSKVWPSGYVVELSTVDPSIVPPQTGDNTSVVGFAMIVVALVAAVVLKKVRA